MSWLDNFPYPDFADRNGDGEVDFNERPDIHYMFDGTYSPQEICQLLSIQLHQPIIAGKTLLFFDEIQACPQAINRLRYFYEKYPEQHLLHPSCL